MIICRYTGNIAPRILLILAAITFALAAPAIVQEKREACVDEVYVPEDVITVLGKRTPEEDLDVLWEGWWHYKNVLGNAAPPPNLPRPEVQMSEAPPPNPAGVHVPVHVPPQAPANSDRAYVPLRAPQSRSTESYPPSAESQSENLKAADSELIGKAKVSRCQWC
jgi:hypothetical protein